ncbi:MAG: ATP-binding cassette domain-containing protein [Bdellovibrionota bacterium]|jgi:ABC-type multidrug transport system ATPase subunit
MNNPSSLLIESEDLLVRYDKTVALDLPQLKTQGNIIGVIGHNGAGKSTFIKVLLGLLPPEKGTISTRNGEDNTLLIPHKNMAFCPETGAVFSDITVREYLSLWCRLKASSPHYLFREGSPILEALELEELLPKRGRELSKGQRQRVQTAAGFFSQPSLFLFDEPFDGLDIQRTHELLELIRDFAKRMSFVVSSHRMDVMELLADEILVLEEGKIRSIGSPKMVSHQLCPYFYRVSGVLDYESSLHSLQKSLPHAFLRRSGDTIRIASSHDDQEKILRLLTGTSQHGATVTRGEPTLTDAMSLYLRAIKKESEANKQDRRSRH